MGGTCARQDKVKYVPGRAKGKHRKQEWSRKQSQEKWIQNPGYTWTKFLLIKGGSNLDMRGLKFSLVRILFGDIGHADVWSAVPRA